LQFYATISNMLNIRNNLPVPRTQSLLWCVRCSIERGNM